MRYKVGVVKKITFLFMTIGLAVALVACQGAVGKTGEPGPERGLPDLPGEPPEPVNLAPIPTVPFATVMLMDGGAAKTVDAAPHFHDPDEDALTSAPRLRRESGFVSVDACRGQCTLQSLRKLPVMLSLP